MDQYEVTFTIAGTGITYIFKVGIEGAMGNLAVEAAIKEKLARQTGVSNGIEIQKIKKLL